MKVSSTGERSSKTVAFFVFAFGLIVSSAASAGYGGHYFRSLRMDSTVPTHCLDLELNHFESQEIQYFTYSIEGGTRRGFDYEYPMSRKDAKVLWKYIKRYISGTEVDTEAGEFRGRPDLQAHFEILREAYYPKDFSFGSEGEVLELLVIRDLEVDLHPDLYVYGSVQYQDRTAGELDIIVAHRSDCSVFGIGEAKLGIKNLSKARKQLNRFREFLRSHIRNWYEALSIVPAM